MSVRSILRYKKRNPVKHISPYTKGTTLNKLANEIAQAMKWNSKLPFGGVYNAVMTAEVIKNYNQGEFRRYPPKGEGSLKEVMKLAVGKKLGIVIK